VPSAFHLEVVSPEAVIWSGEAEMLLTRTSDGELAVMANHEPLMGLLTPWSAVITPATGPPKVVLAVRSGFLQVVGNRVTLLTDLAEVVEGEGPEVVEEARQRAAAMAEAEG
jgi:F-type H+-transporting ATPase subunit epsilon